ncbi:MAG: magnesium transporter [Oscillospiraceae bacterium]|nr:magnesium transporter [Oscillospiraceae bacterium]
MEETTVHLHQLLENNGISAVRAELRGKSVVDIAQALEELEGEELLLVFRILPKDISADVFSYLEPESQGRVVERITDRELSALVNDLFIDDAVDFLEEVPANVVTRVLAQASPDTRSLLNAFLSYPDSSAGSIMTAEFMALHDDITAGQAIDQIRRTGVDKETLDTCYCIDPQRHLLGVVTLRRLLFCDAETPVRSIMLQNDGLIYARTLDDQEQVAQLARRYDLLSIPVVDNEQRLVGIVTIDDIIDVMDEEATEDFELMAKVLPSEKEYLKTGVLESSKNRIVWLLVLMISATFTGLIIENFEHKLALITGLAASIPMLMDTGGNAGSQSSTLIIRGLALGEIRSKDFAWVLWKEVRIALLCGLALAVVNFGRMAVLRFVTHSPISTTVFFVTCLAMICAVLVSKTIGCGLPILAKALRLDPALMAGPLITTIVDAITLMIYFGFANLFLKFPAGV